MKEQKNKQCQNTSYSMENHESEEETGVWEATKESMAKVWGATKEGASKAWDKTKEVTEDITGFGHDDEDENAYFEEESIIDNHGQHIHHSQGFAEDENRYADFSETDGNIPHTPPHHLHETSRHRSSPHTEG